MAKRRRLDSSPTAPSQPALEVKGGAPFDGASAPRTAVPIAQVAGGAADRAALEALSQEVDAIRTEGRLIRALPLDAIETDHLIRDRIGFDADEMAALKSSLAARGQQTAIEVIALEGGRFGLISGWRRVEALKALQEDTVLALVREPDSASDAYVAMIEENEIRANLSFYERARLASEAARAGVYPSPAQAIQDLFASAPAPKRSKIRSFLTVYDALHGPLRHPEAIPEKLGLALAAAIEVDPGFGAKLKDLLRKSAPETAADERAILERSLSRSKPAPKAKSARANVTAKQVSPGLTLELGAGKLVLRGKAVTAGLQKELEAWLRER